MTSSRPVLTTQIRFKLSVPITFNVDHEIHIFKSDTLETNDRKTSGKVPRRKAAHTPPYVRVNTTSSAHVTSTTCYHIIMANHYLCCARWQDDHTWLRRINTCSCAARVGCACRLLLPNADTPTSDDAIDVAGIVKVAS
jgi:hypothetical protein